MPTLGQRAYEVEWCESCPLNEYGDAELDAAKYVYRIVPNRERAFEVAKKMLSSDFFGSVTITPVEWSDPIGERIQRTYRWEYCGDSEHYDGD